MWSRWSRRRHARSSARVRIIDCETHPLLPAGVAAVYERDGGPPADPQALHDLGFGAAREGRFERLPDDLGKQMDDDRGELSLIIRGALPPFTAHLANLVRAH